MRTFEYAGTTDADHPMKVAVAYAHWPFIPSDQWFLPRFRIRVTNLGREIQRGSLQVDIADADSLPTLAGITSHAGPFQDVLHREINSLQAGDTHKFRFSIQSRFLKPGRYILRILFNEWIPSDSPIMELREQLRKADVTAERLKEIETQALAAMKDSGIDPYQRPVGQFRGKLLFDLRFNEVIKIHPLSSVAAILGAFIGSVLAACISFLYALLRLLSEHWDRIRGLFGFA